MKINTAIVIAGGKGTRLKSLEGTNNVEIHKSMVSVLGKPLLERIIEWLKKNGVENLIIGVAYKKESIIDYFGDGSKFGVKIKYSFHDPEGGTGDAFKTAIESTNLSEKYFYAMNSDQLCDFELNKLSEEHMKSDGKALATILLVYPTSPYGNVILDKNSSVLSFIEKPKLPTTSNAGIYLFNKDIKDFLGGSIERNTFAKLAEMGKLKAVVHDGFYETINTFKDLERTEEELRKIDN